MPRLTGLELLTHHQANDGLSRTEKVIAAGYVGKKENGSQRVYFTQYYEAVLFAKGWKERIKLSKDCGGSITVKGIIKAIEEKKDYKKRNDSVSIYQKTLDFEGVDDHILVFFHGNLFCYLQHGKVYLTVSEECQTKSTKERLNRILMRFCGCQIFQKNKVWYVYNPQVGDVEYKYGMAVDFI